MSSSIKRRKEEMRRQKGFTLIELIILLAIIGVIAAIAIPSLLMARIETVTNPFQKHFDIDLRPYTTSKNPDLWLNDGQKAVVRPLVAERLAKICAPYRYSELHKAEPSTDATEVARQLALLQISRGAARQAEYAKGQCAEARYVATRLGLIIETP